MEDGADEEDDLVDPTVLTAYALGKECVAPVRRSTRLPVLAYRSPDRTTTKKRMSDADVSALNEMLRQRKADARRGMATADDVARAFRAIDTYPTPDIGDSNLSERSNAEDSVTGDDDAVLDKDDDRLEDGLAVVEKNRLLEERRADEEAEEEDETRKLEEAKSIFWDEVLHPHDARSPPPLAFDGPMSTVDHADLDMLATSIALSLHKSQGLETCYTAPERRRAIVIWLIGHALSTKHDLLAVSCIDALPGMLEESTDFTWLYIAIVAISRAAGAKSTCLSPVEDIVDDVVPLVLDFEFNGDRDRLCLVVSALVLAVCPLGSIDADERFVLLTPGWIAEQHASVMPPVHLILDAIEVIDDELQKDRPDYNATARRVRLLYAAMTDLDALVEESAQSMGSPKAVQVVRKALRSAQDKIPDVADLHPMAGTTKSLLGQLMHSVNMRYRTALTRHKRTRVLSNLEHGDGADCQTRLSFGPKVKQERIEGGERKENEGGWCGDADRVKVEFDAPVGGALTG
ncbi:hypothetical protein Q5752_002185 [Cryptotrichosporon argae]